MTDHVHKYWFEDVASTNSDGKYTFEEFVSTYQVSADWLRQIAREECGFADAEPVLLDLWLWNRLSIAAHNAASAGAQFSISLRSQVLEELSRTLGEYSGTFQEKCAAAFPECCRNPAREFLPALEPLYVEPNMSDAPGSLPESFADFLTGWGYIIDDSDRNRSRLALLDCTPD